MPKHPHRRAFTLIELLVVLAIIALLVTLLLPAIQSPRGGHGMRGSCRNNMKQIALALQNHHDTFKTFPPLYYSGNAMHKASPELNPANAAEYYSWNTRLLPFLEEDTLYKNISKSSAKFTQPSTKVTVPDPSNKPVSPASYKLSQWICQSNPLDESNNPSHYAALSSTRLPLLLNVVTGSDGQPAYKQAPDGMLVPEPTLRGYPMSRMADGTSRTAVVIESIESARANWYHPRESFVVGFPPADSTPIDAEASNYWPYYGPPKPAKLANGPSRWNFNTAAGNRTALAGYIDDKGPQVPYHPVPGDPLERTWGPSSAHLGGIIIVGMGDGSVQEITLEVDPAVFFSAITVRGAEGLRALGED